MATIPLTYVHYLRDQGRLLRAADVFSKPGWQDRLRKYVTDALAVAYGDAISTDSETQAAIRDGSISPSHWDFRPEGLLVQFGQSEIAAHVMGAPGVVIPWALIKDDLAGGEDLCLCD